MIAELLIELTVLIWDPPERLIRRTWSRFRSRSLPVRLVGVLVCTLMAVGSFVFWFAVLMLILAGPVLLVLELV